jgi:hypothetical protein
MVLTPSVNAVAQPICQAFQHTDNAGSWNLACIRDTRHLQPLPARTRTAKVEWPASGGDREGGQSGTRGHHKP